MKTSTFIILLFLLMTSSVKGQSPVTNAEHQVRNTVVEFFDGLAELDMDKIKRNCTNDLILLEHGEVWNLDTLIIKVTGSKSRNFKRSNRFVFKETIVNRNIAWVVYDNEADFIFPDKRVFVKWLESAVLVRQKKKWKIRMLHSTVIEDNRK